MKHWKISILAMLALFVFTVPAGAITQGATFEPKNPIEIREQARELIKEKRDELIAEGKEKAQEVRTRICERRKDAFEKRAEKFVANAEKYQSVVDKLFERVQGFYESGQLTAPDYDALVAKANEAKTQAEDSIQTLKDTEINIDCENPSVAESVATFRGVAGQTREALHNYSTSIKNIISAMKSANAGGTSGDNGGEAAPTGEGE